MVARTDRHSGRLQRPRHRAHRTQDDPHALPPGGLVHRRVPRVPRRGGPRPAPPEGWPSASDLTKKFSLGIELLCLLLVELP